VTPGFAPDTREYSEDEERALYANLRRTARAVHQGDHLDAPLDVALLCALHRGIFGGIRSHAGRCRGPGEGQEYLIFGPHRSHHRDEVAAALARIFAHAARGLRSVLAQPDAATFELDAIVLAARVHADVIRVHPFEDGNGRSCRLLLDWILLRLRVRPAPPEAPKEEYIACLNHYFVHGDLQPLVDFYVRLLGEGSESRE